MRPGNALRQVSSYNIVFRAKVNVLCAVRKVTGDVEPSFLAELHLDHTLVPAWFPG